MTKQERQASVEAVSRDDGRRLAEAFRDQADPFPNVPHALLSAEDIAKYVFATGAISPFYPSDECGRLKKAAYEGRIGDAAYIFDEYGALAPLCVKPLVVGANSIVFVESDIDFRLPDFLALRFNLQIRHVHRGLLLGTGPLVDPGFWGKLCIPLHNLTDEDYSIPKDEGLIWIEVTKTSLKKEERATVQGVNPLREKPKGYWDIKDLIHKAAAPIAKEGKTVAIRSSIPMVAREATSRAKGAEKAAREARYWIRVMGGIGLIALIGIGAAFYTNIQSAYNAISPRVDGVVEKVTKLEDAVSRVNALEAENKKLLKRVRNLEGGNKTEEDQQEESGVAE